MKRKTLFFLTLLFVFSTYINSYALSGVNVRVRILDDEDAINLVIKGSYTVRAINSNLILDKGRRLRNTKVRPMDYGLIVGDKEYKIYAIRIIPNRDATIYVNKKCLRGIIDIIRTEKRKLLVINHIDLEKYLYGVLYHEMPHYWPMETLKAQAITARTFAVYRKDLMKDRGYDVTSDIYAQVYGGRSSERRATTRAVNATKGKVLKYKNEILPAYYHSMCAGYTEDAEIVFGINLPPLKGRRCHFCRGARGMNWKAMFSYKQMEKRLNDYGIKVKDMSYIKEGKRDRSGRLVDIVIRDKTGIKRIKGFKFRLALGPNLIRSTNFNIKITPKGVIMKGKGWGHGVGMCQWGAFGMGKRRHNHRQILEFYYPKALITDI